MLEWINLSNCACLAPDRTLYVLLGVYKSNPFDKAILKIPILRGGKNGNVYHAD